MVAKGSRNFFLVVEPLKGGCGGGVKAGPLREKIAFFKARKKKLIFREKKMWSLNSRGVGPGGWG